MATREPGGQQQRQPQRDREDETAAPEVSDDLKERQDALADDVDDILADIDDVLEDQKAKRAKG